MFTIILAEPEHPGNIGSVCRVMHNFGLTKLVLINPQCDVNQETKNLAKNAQEIVKQIRITGWKALNEFDVIVGTAGKTTTDQNLLRSPLTPKDAAQKLLAVKGNIALLFGRESDGLTNDELRKCDFVIQIPTSSKNPSLNLSHSVAVIAAELYAAGSIEPLKKFTPIPPAEKVVLFNKVDALLDSLTFPTEGKRTTQKKIWRSIFGRSILTKAESHAILGFFRALERQQSQPRTTAKKRTVRAR